MPRLFASSCVLHHDDGDGSFDDIGASRDQRGWAMRRGHCKRLVEARRCRGRAVFARTINARPRLYEHFPKDYHKHDNPKTEARLQLSAYTAAQARCQDITETWWEPVYDVCELDAEEVRQCKDEDTGQDEEDTAEVEAEANAEQAKIVKETEVSEVASSMSTCTGTCGDSSSDELLPQRCWLCCTSNTPLPMHCCPFCKRLARSTSRWEVAFWRAQLAAQTLPLEMPKSRDDSSESKKMHELNLPEGAFDRLRQLFLDKHGSEIRSALENLYCRSVRLEPTQLSTQVKDRFFAAAGQIEHSTLPTNLCLAFHGTNPNCLPSIFERGFLIPSNENQIRVVHGSAYGNGIYTSLVTSVSMSHGYCAGGDGMLVCGLLDDQQQRPDVVSRYPWGKVVFDERRIAPLFVAITGAARVAPPCYPVLPASPVKFYSPMQSASKMKEKKKQKQKVKDVQRCAAQILSTRMHGFIFSRAARKRSFRKIPSSAAHAM